ncbi:hypothetical protein E0K83_02220 [Gramella sp. BOM4]|nr:hypothetical protein [Christiangramia bathymodioli]
MRYIFPLKEADKLLFLMFCLFSLSAFSQEYSFGLKAGASYSLNDNGSEIFTNGERYSADSDFGYQGGAFLELKFGKWLVRPEALFNTARGEFVFRNFTSNYTIEKLSFPLLLGYTPVMLMGLEL